MSKPRIVEAPPWEVALPAGLAAGTVVKAHCACTGWLVGPATLMSGDPCTNCGERLVADDASGGA